jgi:transposase-like protein
MEDESKTADGRRRWQHWTEEQARSALSELAQSGVSIAKFAEIKGVSAQRIAYWRKRLANGGPPRFVRVDMSMAVPPTTAHIEILLDGVTVRVRENLDPETVARLVEAFARRPREC